MAERSRDLLARDDDEVDRQRATRDQVRELGGGRDREAALDLAATRRVDPARVLREVDVGDRDEPCVEHDREVLEVVVAADRVLRAALRDPRGHVQERVDGAAAEAERDDLLAALRVRLGARVRDVLTADRGVVLEDVVEVVGGVAAVVGRQRLAHDRAGLDVDELGTGGQLLARLRDVEVQVPDRLVEGGLVTGCGNDLAGGRQNRLRLWIDVVDRPVLRRHERLVMVLGTAGGALDGGVFGERVCRRSGAAAPLCGVVPRHRVVVRSARLAARPEHARLPVVEVELPGRADRRLGLRDVLRAREAHVDLVAPGASDRGVGEAERVDAGLDDVDRLADRARIDLGAARRAALEDQLDAALEVEAELRLLRLDDPRDPGRDEQREDDDPGDQRQHEGVAAAVTHRVAGSVIGKRSVAKRCSAASARRRQDQQQATVVIVGGEEVGCRGG